MQKKTKPWWHPSVHLKNRPHQLCRLRTMREIRRFFDARDFWETDTPALQVSPGMEVHLQAFQTHFQGATAGESVPLYLHTSPEFAMKKLLAAGLPRIYQLARAFRNEAFSATHHPEFTLLEWYRAGASYAAMMADTEELVKACAQAAGVSRLRFGALSCDPFGAWERLSVSEAFQKYAGIDLMATLPPEPSIEPDPDPLAQAAARIGISCNPRDRWEDVFFRIMLNRIEGNLGAERPAFLYDYPICLGALARRKPEDPRLAERFECYACGLELCNGFSELIDAQEQQGRFLYDAEMKRKLYGFSYPADDDFLEALRSGLPESGGNALGVDRLIMLLSGAQTLEETLWAPVRLPAEA